MLISVISEAGVFTHGVIAQVGKFGAVGILNTLIDFGIFNVLSSRRVGFSKVSANICSTSVAMIFSFFANRQAVFHAGTGNPLIQAILFFVVTGFGLYVLQTGALYLLTHRWSWPKKLVSALMTVTGLKRRLSVDFALKNVAKAAATVLSLVWNFILYKYVVFA